MSERLKKYNEKQAIIKQEKEALKNNKNNNSNKNQIRRYTKEEIAFVKTKVSFAGSISSTLMDFWLDWREKNSY